MSSCRIETSKDPNIVSALIKGCDRLHFMLSAGNQFLEFSIPRFKVDTNRMTINGPLIEVETFEEYGFGFAVDSEKSVLWIEKTDDEIILTINTRPEGYPNGE